VGASASARKMGTVQEEGWLAALLGWAPSTGEDKFLKQIYTVTACVSIPAIAHLSQWKSALG